MITKSVLIVCCLLVFCTAQCPSKCRCLGPWARCINVNLADISGDFPHEVETMTLIHLDLRTAEAGAFASLSISPRLWKLELFQGNLETIKENAFEGLEALQSLYITQNRLRTVEGGAFRGLINLGMLDLSHNELSTLPPNVFQGLGSISKIFINDNKQLRSLDLGIIEWLPSLEELSAKYCSIDALEPMRSRAITSIHLDLRVNPLNCNCYLKNALSVLRSVLGVCDGKDVKEVLETLYC